MLKNLTYVYQFVVILLVSFISPILLAEIRCESVFAAKFINRVEPVKSNGLSNEDYTLKDFPSSKYWTRGGVDQYQYSSTASETANKVAGAVKNSNHDLTAIFETVRKWRETLTNKGSPFRANNPDLKIFFTTLSGAYSEFRDIIFDLYLPQNLSTHEVQTFYITRSGKKLNSSNFQMISPYALPDLFPKGKVTVEHPLNSIEFYDEAISILNEIRHNSDRSGLAIDKFVEAMYAYYISVPLWAGSASIGKVFFAGFFLGTFGYKMPELPDEIDLLAIVNSADDRKHIFIEKISQILKQNSKNKLEKIP